MPDFISIVRVSIEINEDGFPFRICHDAPLAQTAFSVCFDCFPALIIGRWFSSIQIGHQIPIPRKSYTPLLLCCLMTVWVKVCKILTVPCVEIFVCQCSVVSATEDSLVWVPQIPQKWILPSGLTLCGLCFLSRIGRTAFPTDIPHSGLPTSCFRKKKAASAKTRARSRENNQGICCIFLPFWGCR